MTPELGVETTELTKRYGRGRGVERLSLTVPRGEVFGFLGSEGAGKTTTIRMGRAGRILPGSTGELVLPAAPCPVTVAR